MADRQVAADRLKRAIVTQERIFVFGDYDCDGITSTAILTEVLRELGGDVKWGLGSRFDGGYGVSSSAVRRIVESEAKLLVTCDCGSSDHDNLQLVSQAGLDVIVIDHHLVPDAPLPVQAFLNPHRAECGFPYKGLASCGLALSIAAALRQALGSDIDLRRWLDLVAIGSIADVAPLDGDNRALVRAGLARLSEAPRPGLRALMALAELEPGRPLSARDVAFRIAPRINAPGRLGSAELALELLLAKTAEEAQSLASQVEQKSTERRALQQTMIEQALEEIEREGWQDSAALTLGRQDWNHGIVGIVAGRLADQFQRPVIVIGFDGDVGRGSVRGPRGAKLHDALSQVQSTMVRFGGHQAAAGVEVEHEKLVELRQRFAEVYAARSQSSAPGFEDPQVPVVELCAGDELDQVLKDLMRLEPCGEANPCPELSFVADLVRAKEVRGGHLKLELELGSGQRLAGFGVNQGALAETLGGRVRVTGSLQPDRWRGGDAVEVRVSSVCDCTNSSVGYETIGALSG
jgi:single-stranded-DNA-specific exonuclease